MQLPLPGQVPDQLAVEAAIMVTHPGQGMEHILLQTQPLHQPMSQLDHPPRLQHQITPALPLPMLLDLVSPPLDLPWLSLSNHQAYNVTKDRLDAFPQMAQNASQYLLAYYQSSTPLACSHVLACDWLYCFLIASPHISRSATHYVSTKKELAIGTCILFCYKLVTQISSYFCSEKKR